MIISLHISQNHADSNSFSSPMNHHHCIALPTNSVIDSNTLTLPDKDVCVAAYKSGMFSNYKLLNYIDLYIFCRIN